MDKRITLILGGARSGKSTYAEKLAASFYQPVVYIATAAAGDAEMEARIAVHRASRPTNWDTIEAQFDPGKAVLSSSVKARVFLLDCVTLWTSNVILKLPEPYSIDQAQAAMEEEVRSLLQAVDVLGGEWIIVSNEVGLGLVPPYELGRIYRDTLGRVNQRIAAAADRVLFMVAGYPMLVKPVANGVDIFD